MQAETGSVDLLRWVWRDGRFALLAAGGRVIFPPALDVYRSVFRGVNTFDGLPIDNSLREIAPDIDFSNQAAPVVCHISIHRDAPRVQLAARVPEGLASLKKGQDQIVIGGKWYPVAVEAADLTADRLREIGVSLNAPLVFRDYIQLRSRAGGDLVVVDSVDSSAWRGPSDLAALRTLRATLYPYQLDGVSYLKFVVDQRLGCVLADEMGLGKTLQILALMTELTFEQRGPFLVVCPSSLLENWRREAGAFAPGLTVTLHGGPDRPGIVASLGLVDLTIVSYDTLVRDEEIFASRTWELVVLDEAQAIKNPGSLRAKAAIRLKRSASIAVTGTPIENRLEDLWSIFAFCAPWLLGSRDAFTSTYGSEERRDTLAKLISPLVLRRRVADVATDLPERLDVPLLLTMPPAMAAEYERVRLAALSEFGKAGAMVALTRLRALCAAISPQTSGAVDPKWERLIGILDEAFHAGEKCLIFASFRKTADSLLAGLRASYPGAFFEIIDGRTEVAARQDLIDGFFRHEGGGAFVLNPRAAGTGLNITAANHVIHLNPEWNPALTAQATARAYRRRQQKPVTIHHLMYADTVEDVIREVSNSKAELAENVIEGNAGGISPAMLAKALAASPISFESRS